jgi:Tol biopolymer transport system component
MSLSPGVRLGPYEVTATLGAGGMGEVYLATDTNLGRQVAIKVLPAALAADPERLARFDREARTLAAINHPNIAAIYGFERAAQSTAIVMEMVDGPTLADRIAQGPLPLDEALPIARQIAEALDAAHERTIVHRDLKPANIKVRPDGTVKVLDFGLAKPMEAADPVAASSFRLSLSPTMASPTMTQAGMLLGTAAYMSPEQARGRPVDKRADIWAFGCVLFEMVTGRSAFGGADVTETLAAIVKDQPPLNEVPAQLRTLIGRCLEKDPRQRLRDIGDAMSLVAGGGPSADAPRMRRRQWLAMAGWMVAGVLLAAFAIAMRGRPAAGREIAAPVVRFQIAREPDVYNRTASAFGVSPDGRMLAYYARGSDGPQTLVVRTLATGELREVPGSATAAPTPNSIFWSRDSRQLVRGTASGAQVFDLSAGTVRPLCECRYNGGTWSQDGTILLGGFGLGDGISRVSPGERQPVAITKPDSSTGEQDTWPVFLPDGRRFLFTRTNAGGTDTYVGTLEGGAPARVADGSARIVAARSGGMFMLVISGVGLVALPFDLATARVIGMPTTLVAGAVAASASDGGVLATSAAGNRPNTVPTWFDRKGAALGTVGEPAYIDGIALSSDGRKLARSEALVGAARQTAAVWLEDVTNASRSRVTFDASGSTPVWSPTATVLAFTSSRNGVNLPYQRSADGTGGETPLFPWDRHGWVNDWSRDGQWILFSSPARERTGNDLWVVPVGGAERKPQLYAGGPGLQQQAQFSPDGRFVAYGSDQSGNWEIYVQPFPNASDGKWLVASGGVEPRWSPDGTELFYFSGQTLMTVPVRVTPTFSAGTAVPLFDAAVVPNYTSDSHRWQLSPDGRRFLLLVVAGGSEAPPLDVIVNWPERLNQGDDNDAERQMR